MPYLAVRTEMQGPQPRIPLCNLGSYMKKGKCLVMLHFIQGKIPEEKENFDLLKVVIYETQSKEVTSAETVIPLLNPTLKIFCSCN